MQVGLGLRDGADGFYHVVVNPAIEARADKHGFSRRDAPWRGSDSRDGDARLHDRTVRQRQRHRDRGEREVAAAASDFLEAPTVGAVLVARRSLGKLVWLCLAAPERVGVEPAEVVKTMS